MMKKPVALGANIFAGGFSLGVSKHFRLLGHLEHDDYGAAVARQNLNLPIYIGKEGWPEKLPEKIDWLYANPPCAIWSVAGAKIGGGRADWRLDPRLQRIRDIFSLVDRYKPAVWCWESVCQAFSKGREFVEELADEAKKRGYSATYLLIDARYLGVAQVRKRFFLVLHRIEIDWKKATPDFTRVITSGQALKGVRPLKELITKMTPGEAEILKKTKPGQRLSKVYDATVRKPKIGSRGQKLGRPSFLKYRLDPSRPSNTVIGDSVFHHREDRFLTVNECAALSGYPQSWKWPKADGHNLLARGVMPPVGEWLAKQVAAAVRRRKKIGRPRRFMVDFREAPGHVYEIDGDGKEGAGLRVMNLDWKPGDVSTYYQSDANVSAHQHKAPRAGGGPQAGRGPRPSGTGRPEAGRRKAGRGSLGLAELAEATRRGIPDKNGRVLIRQALQALKAGKLPESSGMLIRARLLEGRKTEHEIVDEVLHRYKNRKTTLADVGYHRYKMRRAGMDV